jgi:membrane-bound acyltransferase YfiQ involved in biofilm formation
MLFNADTRFERRYPKVIAGVTVQLEVCDISLSCGCYTADISYGMHLLGSIELIFFCFHFDCRIVDNPPLKFLDFLKYEVRAYHPFISISGPATTFYHCMYVKAAKQCKSRRLN